MKNKIYPREGDRQTVYLKEVVSDPNIEVGEWTIYNDFAADPVDFERNNVPYHYPVNGDRLEILLAGLRRAVPLQQRQPYAQIAVHLSVPDFLGRGVGHRQVGGGFGVGQPGRHRCRQ